MERYSSVAGALGLPDKELKEQLACAGHPLFHDAKKEGGHTEMSQNFNTILRQPDGTDVAVEMRAGEELDGKIISSCFICNDLYYIVELYDDDYFLHNSGGEEFYKLTTLVVHACNLRVSRKEEKKDG